MIVAPQKPEIAIPMVKKASTRSEVLQLTIANGIEAALRLLIPIVLVRLLDQAEYGQYRFFWLVGNTLLLFVPLGIGRSLLYFLPRSTPAERGAFVSQSILYFIVVSLPIALCISFAPAWMPDKVSGITDPPLILGAFTFVWLLSSLITVLPNANREIRWQAMAISILALIRTVLIVSVAWITRDLQAVFLALLGFTSLQCLLLGYYVVSRHGKHLTWPSWAGLSRQFTYSAPFGISGILSRARRHIEQWIVVFLFAAESLAIFSIAVSFNGFLSLLRSSVGNVVLPKMSRIHAGGDASRALDLNNRGNLAICFVTYPFVAYIWVFAEPMIGLLYTSSYLDAVPVLRVYALNMLATSVELATVLLIYEQGRFVMVVSAGVLFFASLLSYVGAVTFGLPGVAIGGLVGTIVTRLLNFHRAAKMLGVGIGEIQDWITLGRMLAAAVAAGIVARAATRFIPGLDHHLSELIVGFAILSIGYLALTWLLRFDWVPRSMLGRQSWPDSLNSL